MEERTVPEATRWRKVELRKDVFVILFLVEKLQLLRVGLRGDGSVNIAAAFVMQVHLGLLIRGPRTALVLRRCWKGFFAFLPNTW